MKFTGTAPTSEVVTSIGFAEGVQDKELMELVRDSIKCLTGCVGAARAVTTKDADPGKEAARQLLVGYAMLAIGEGHSLLMLCSLGYERSARIHYRALNEYHIRASIMLESGQQALDFVAAAIQETRRLGQMLGMTEAQIDEGVQRYYSPFTPEKVGTEKAALGGDMRTIMLKRTGDNKTYAVDYAWASSYVHSTVLALYEVAQAIKDATSNFVPLAARDGMGAAYLLGSHVALTRFIIDLTKQFRIDTDNDLKQLAERMAAVNLRLKIAPIAPKEDSK